MEDLLYKIALTKIPLVGAKIGKTLVSYCGGCRGVFEASKKELLKIPGIGEKTITHILSKKALEAAEVELNFIEANQIQPYFYLDKNYPSRLKQYPDCPLILYYKGSLPLLNKRVVAIVGTRKPSPFGIANCEKLVEALKAYDVLILSGLAMGIDITAHRQALDYNIPTIGVLGHGLNRIYPYHHKKTALEMVKYGGLLTEFCSSKGPEREHFPMRNRIIAGLCDALVVVETAKKGGSMISAHLACQYNKDIFAFPGRVNDRQSKGCNHLIKTHMAALIEHSEDLAYLMGWDKADAVKSLKTGIQREMFIQLTEEEKIIVALLKQTEVISFDHLFYSAKLSSSKMASLLLNLEFKGLIKQLPGQRYILVS